VLYDSSASETDQQQARTERLKNLPPRLKPARNLIPLLVRASRSVSPPVTPTKVPFPREVPAKLPPCMSPPVEAIVLEELKYKDLFRPPCVCLYLLPCFLRTSCLLRVYK